MFPGQRSLVTYSAYDCPPERCNFSPAAIGGHCWMSRHFTAALASAVRSRDLCRSISGRGQGVPFANRRCVRVRAEHRHPTRHCLAEESGSRAVQHRSVHACIWVAVQSGSGTKCTMHLDVER